MSELSTTVLQRVLILGVLGALAALLLTFLPWTATAQEESQEGNNGGTTIASGLNGPVGVLAGPEGKVWTIDAGTGGDREIPFISPQTLEPTLATVGNTARVTEVSPDGEQRTLARLPSISVGQENIGGANLALQNGTLYATNGQWAEGAGIERIPKVAAVVEISDEGSKEVASTWDFEQSQNPDGFSKNSNPYGLAPGPDGDLLVGDAAANDLLKVDPQSGEIETLAVFEGLPAQQPNPGRGGASETDPVPTGVAVDRAGSTYVSLLPGAPVSPGSAKILKVTPSGEVSDYATGLTSLIDVAFRPDGALYAVQLAEFTVEGPTPGTGAIVRITENGPETVLDDLSFPTSIDFDDSGAAYLATDGLGPPGSGKVVKFDDLNALSAEQTTEQTTPGTPDTPDAGGTTGDTTTDTTTGATTGAAPENTGDGPTEAPDLVSVGSFREGPPDDAGNPQTLVDYTFDQAVYFNGGDRSNFSLVPLDGGDAVDGRPVAPGANTEGDEVVSVLYSGTLDPEDFARGFLDTSVINSDPENVDSDNPFNVNQSEPVSNNGATENPDLVSISRDGENSFLYEFDEPLTTDGMIQNEFYFGLRLYFPEARQGGSIRDVGALQSSSSVEVVNETTLRVFFGENLPENYTLDDAVGGFVIPGTVRAAQGSRGANSGLNAFDEVILSKGAAGSTTGEPEATKVSTRVEGSRDDAEQKRRTGQVRLDSGDLDMARAGTRQEVGVRFGLDVPQGATIERASVQFTADENQNREANLRIRSQRSNDAWPFRSRPFDITVRPRTFDFVGWDPPAWTAGEAGSAQQTPDLSSLVQKAVDRPGWSDGNDLAFIVSGRGKRSAVSYEANPQAAPVLHVEYTTE